MNNTQNKPRIITNQNTAPFIIQNGNIYQITTSNSTLTTSQPQQTITQQSSINLAKPKIIYRTTAQDIQNKPPIVLTTVKQNIQQQNSQVSPIIILSASKTQNDQEKTRANLKKIPIQQIVKQTVKSNSGSGLLNILNDNLSKCILNSNNLINENRENLTISTDYLNKYLIPDSRVLKNYLRKFEPSSTTSKVQFDNNKELQIAYRLVTINNVEHVLLENSENLNNFKENIEKLQSLACMLATKLNKPVTIPAYLLVKKTAGFSEESVRELFRENKLTPVITELGLSEKQANPELSSLLKKNDPKKITLKLKEPISTLSKVPHKLEAATKIPKDDFRLESFNQLANTILSRKEEDVNEAFQSETSTQTRTQVEPQEINDHISSQHDYDFNFDSFDPNVLLNMDLNEIDYSNFDMGSSLMCTNQHATQQQLSNRVDNNKMNSLLSVLNNSNGNINDDIVCLSSN
jgi:hypothetical protein